MSYRLPPIPGEWIDRNQPIEFFFEGDRVWGYAGDTITSALWAAEKRVLGRSFKYHRPRGILSFANHDVNVLMQQGQTLNVRADVTKLEAGMSLAAVNTNGGVMGDRNSILNLFSSFLPVGFYYKAFHNRRLFPFWERIIRNISGLGKLDTATPQIRTAKQYDFCDVLVIGAGVAGLSAAIAAAEAGADVVIVDENARAGGSGSYQLGGEWSRAEKTNGFVNAVKMHDRIQLYPETIAAGYYADHWIPLVDANRLTKMRTKAVIMANGAYEQPAVFRNNDLPGIMLASAAQRLIYRYAVKPMNQAVMLIANWDGYQAALDLIQQGIEVKAIVDLRPAARISSISPALQRQGIPIYTSHCIYEARGNPARDGVVSAVICPIDAYGNPQTESKQTIACDGIVMSVGWAPAANLLYQAGAKMRFDDHLQQFVPEQLPEGVFACGRVNGVYEFEQKVRDGQRAGLEAVAFLDKSRDRSRDGSRDRLRDRSGKTDSAPKITPSPTVDRTLSESPSHPWAIVPHPDGKNFVDFDEDLQFKDFPNAVQEGFDNIELLKRFTTVGMGSSQGKHSNMNALRILARITGKSPGEVGTTTARPFFHPVPLSHLAGRGFTPERQTPLHSRHTALNAKWMLAGTWRRPEYYQQPGKSREDCIRSEVEAVRQRVGMIDVGTLGKIEIRGSDAAAFLERIYTGRYSSLKVGMSRYALMLDEAGVVRDDGVVARLGTEHFYFTTTTSGAATIYRELSRWNTLWQMDCGLVNLTGARSAINLAGPNARALLAKLTDCDLSGVAFPYLAVRETQVAGISALLTRVGFVGEWGYEIHVAAESAPLLWDAIWEAGQAWNIAPFGVEAQRLLRLEKGHLLVGQDTDGLTTPGEAGLAWAVKLDKPFFIGQRSLQAIAKRPVKQTQVGFMLAPNFQQRPPQECHLIIDDGEIVGRVTSIAFSPTLQRYIGLAFVKPELAAVGTPLSIRLSDRSIVIATVSPTPFYDPDNQRQQETVIQRQEVTA
ncbi:MAG TPA: 2Fe-2S iron-sulfur cluster-binding protein [Trichocoleus sp.]|jgi:sarcosine oxidase subunit alpha